MYRRQAEKLDSYFLHDNGDWEYEDEQGYWHLFRDDIELTKNIKAKWIYSFDNGDWQYQDEDGETIIIKAENSSTGDQSAGKESTGLRQEILSILANQNLGNQNLVENLVYELMKLIKKREGEK